MLSLNRVSVITEKDNPAGLGRQVENVKLPGLGSWAVTLSRDCKTCYFVRTEREHGNLMLVEGFK